MSYNDNVNFDQYGQPIVDYNAQDYQQHQNQYSGGSSQDSDDGIMMNIDQESFNYAPSHMSYNDQSLDVQHAMQQEQDQEKDYHLEDQHQTAQQHHTAPPPPQQHAAQQQHPAQHQHSNNIHYNNKNSNIYNSNNNNNSNNYYEYGTSNNIDNDNNGYQNGSKAPLYQEQIYDEFDPYPAYNLDKNRPIDIKKIEDIFIDLTNKLGFQRDSMRNMFDHFMTLLDSRSSRMSSQKALISLHADYIGGDTSNYKKWYFTSQLDLDDEIGFRNFKLNKSKKKMNKNNRSFLNTDNNTSLSQEEMEIILNQLKSDNSLEASDFRWKYKMMKLSPYEMVKQLALYLLCWGEANQVRFTPECLCFIYKCALDFSDSITYQNMKPQNYPMEGDYLNRIITPIYQFLRDQVYEILDGRYVKREKDHNSVIGYDDVNQLFWYPEGIKKIKLANSNDSLLIDLPIEERYLHLGQINWNDVFFKTYKETRTWLHMVTNFNRIWIMHASVYWMYTAYNAPSLYTHNYQQLLDNQPLAAYRWASAALGGTLASLIQIAATLCEWLFVPRNWAGAQRLSKRFLFLCIVLGINLAPIVWIFAYTDDTVYSKDAKIVSIVMFFVAVVTVVFFSVRPLGALFTSYMNRNSRVYVSSQTFTANFAPLYLRNQLLSYFIWIVVFGAKFAESYYFLTLSLRDPIRILSTLTMRCGGEYWWGNALCKHQPKIVLGLMIATDFILFFLDTYLWYVIINSVFSVSKLFYIGMSVLTPWRNIFTRLPKRIYLKILATNDMEVKYKPKILISQIWNAIIISMYREHLLAIDHVQKLLYHQVPSDVPGRRALRAPTFFTSQVENLKGANKISDFFPEDSETERRISFFAQSLTLPLPTPVSIENMPTFTVLTPHYSERILLSLREIIREDDQFSRVTLLEYLKQLHPIEWDCFVKDTKFLAEETEAYEDNDQLGMKEQIKDDQMSPQIDDLPFYCIGFKSAAPEYTLRTRIWASLRSQTLYRTVSGMMNYARAIKLLYRVENPEVVQMFGGNVEGLENELEKMSRRKFKYLVSMQRLTKFKPHEMENAEFLLRAYPDLQIAFLDEEPPLHEGEEPRVFSSLIDGHCEILENGRRRPKFRIQLSGNPILGDGKSDNQNHALIFYRGEYIQLIDANQDNYLEECLKIRSVLAEFEDLNMDPMNPYVPGVKYENQINNHPVAIVGAREYIFSENSGVLGDVAAGKEQTFGTLFARTLSQIGGKLHYGHPDFVNATFMTTRGGVSKAQKGLHLNEDIYSGMNAMLRGGRIKHCEYYQCGKGRDLGFGTILNFTTKIGAGMGEQMLSREYYYLGTQLPIDRFLSFYYAHPGFHLNNFFIQLSLQLFLLTLVNMHSMAHEAIFCSYDRNKPSTDVLYPIGCYNLQPVVDWVRRYTLSIFIVFWIAIVPIIGQELVERGLWKATLRFFRQILSLSPVFEVFAGQIYSASLLSDLTVGGARYISTGRGFATARIPFSILYSRFAGSAIYMGSRSLIMLLFSTVAHWQAPLLWFWASICSLMWAPFIFNPHQFAWEEFFLDYRDYIRWLSRGNTKYHKNSWIGYVKLARSRVTGFKRKLIGVESEKGASDTARAHRTNVIAAEIIPCAIYAAGCFISYTFINAQTGVQITNDERANSTLRFIICTVGPIAVNAGTLLICMAISCCSGPLFGLCCKRTSAALAAIAHGVSVLVYLGTFIIMWVLEGFHFTRMLIGIVACIQAERLIFQCMTVLLLSREQKHDSANTAFWSGTWASAGYGSLSWGEPFREYIAKIIEMSEFAADFILGHALMFGQLPILCIPQIDKLHSIMLFWLKPSRQIRPPILSLKQTRLRRRMVTKYMSLFIIVLCVFAACIIGPAVGSAHVSKSFGSELTGSWTGLVQQRNRSNNDTGTRLSTYSGHYYTHTPTLKTWSTTK